ATGVHSPTISRPLVSSSRPYRSGVPPPFTTCGPPSEITCTHCPRRSINNATAGQDSGKNEYNRCMRHVKASAAPLVTPARVTAIRLVKGAFTLRLNESASDGRHHRLSSIPRTEFGQEIPDMPLRGLFVNGERHRDFAIGVTVGEQL